MDLSIVIVNWNTRELLARCLESVVRRQLSVARHSADRDTEQRPLATEVFGVDNASTDGSVQMVREHFPWVRLIENTKNVGFAAADNQTIRQSQGRYLVLLNSDTEVFPGALETMVQFMEEHLQVGGCGPLLLNADGSLRVSCRPMLTPEREFRRVLRSECTQHHYYNL